MAGISAEKAKTILRDGTIRGNKLTTKQRHFFGAIAGGTKMKKASVSSRQMIADGIAEMKDGGGTKFIQSAIKRPGALTAKAKAAGESTQAYAREHAHDPGRTGKQARLAITLSKLPHAAEGAAVTNKNLGKKGYGGYGTEDMARTEEMADGGGVKSLGYDTHVGKDTSARRLILEGYKEGGVVDPATGLAAVAQVANLYGDKGIAALRLGQAAARRLHRIGLGYGRPQNFEDLLRQETARAFRALGSNANSTSGGVPVPAALKTLGSRL